MWSSKILLSDTSARADTVASSNAAKPDIVLMLFITCIVLSSFIVIHSLVAQFS